MCPDELEVLFVRLIKWACENNSSIMLKYCVALRVNHFLDRPSLQWLFNLWINIIVL